MNIKAVAVQAFRYSRFQLMKELMGQWMAERNALEQVQAWNSGGLSENDLARLRYVRGKVRDYARFFSEHQMPGAQKAP